MFVSRKLTVCVGAFVLISSGSAVQAKEWHVDGDVDSQVEYNDNIFLSDAPHDDVYGLIVSPSIRAGVKEKHWSTDLEARVRSNNYNQHELDTNDQYLDLSGQYSASRSILGLDANYNLDSNLNSTSSDFGVFGRRINRKYQSLSPRYIFLITERSSILFQYSYTDVKYIEAEDTGFTPYVTNSLIGKYTYGLSEITKLNLSLQAVDYESEDMLTSYELLMSRIGVEHELSEIWQTDFTIGVSRRNTTNRNTVTYDFFGNQIVQTTEIDSSDRGLVLDAGITRLLENGKIEARISRDDTTNSFGGLNQVDRFKLNYGDKVSKTMRYLFSTRYEDIEAVSTGARNTDRQILFFESILYYSLAENWDMSASYRYIQRKFRSDTSDKAPHSNRIYLGLTYNFPSLSTQ